MEDITLDSEKRGDEFVGGVENEYNGKESIEGKVSDAILENLSIVEIGGRSYRIASPSIGTLIMASKEIAKLPKLELNSEHILEESLFVAKDCEVVADILTIFILGAKEMKRVRNRFFGWFFGRRRRAIKDSLLNEYTPRELFRLCARVLSGMQVQDFFGLTTFLIGVNLTHQTKVVKGN